MSLKRWLENSWIIRIEPSRSSLRNLMRIARREVEDGSLEGISPDGRFEHAYAAVRALGEAALHAAGYTAHKGARKHEIVIESLKHTLGSACSQDVEYLDRCRRLRNRSVYDRAGVVSRETGDELLESAKKLCADVQGWLQRHHSGLI